MKEWNHDRTLTVPHHLAVKIRLFFRLELLGQRCTQAHLAICRNPERCGEIVLPGCQVSQGVRGNKRSEVAANALQATTYQLSPGVLRKLKLKR